VARYCFQLQVRPERLDEYRERHRAVWPDMLAALRDARWQAEMAPFFADLEGHPDEGFLLLDEVFHLEDQLDR
jgi:L-rhamnose mutarotase